MTFSIQDYVLRLDITIENFIFVESLNTQKNLTGIIFDKFFLEFFPFLEQFREIPTFTEIHDQKEIGFSLKGISQFNNEWMVNERQNLLLSLNVPIQVCAEHSLLSDGLQGEKFIFAIFLDKIDLPKSTLSDSFIKFETSQSDSLSHRLFLHELIQFKYVLLSAGQLVLLLFVLLLLAASFCLQKDAVGHVAM